MSFKTRLFVLFFLATLSTIGFQNCSGKSFQTLRDPSSINNLSSVSDPSQVSQEKSTIEVINSNQKVSAKATADGSNSITLKITLRSADGIPVTGVTPRFEATNTNSKNVYSPCPPTDKEGVSLCTLASTKAEAKDISLSFPVSKSGPRVEFVAGPADSANSKIIVLTPANPDGSDQAVVQVQLQDKFNNPIAGIIPRLSSTGTSSTTCEASDSNGLAVCRSTSSNSGPQTLSLVEPPLPVSGPITFEYTANSNSSIEPISTNASALANGVAQVTIEIILRDQNNQPITNTIPTFSIAGATAGVCASTGRGVYRCTASSLEVGDKRIQLESPFRISSSGVVRFNPGPISLAKSSLQIPSTMVADGTSSANIVVRLRDEWDHALSTPVPALVATGTQNSITACQPSGPDFLCLLRSTKAEVKNISFSNLSLTGQITFTAGTASPSLSRIILPGALYANGNFQAVQVNLLDANNNFISGATPVLAQSNGSQINFGTCASTNDRGEARCEIKTSEVGNYSINIASPVASNLQQVEFLAPVLKLSDLPYCTNGIVYDSAYINETLYVSGEFTKVGLCQGQGVFVDNNSNQILTQFPSIYGTIYTSTSDLSGGLFVGGQISRVGNQNVSGIARISASGTVTPISLQFQYFNEVRALKVVNNTLWVGGSFRTTSGKENLLALDISNNFSELSLTQFPDSSVNRIETFGNTLFISGDFTTVGGVNRNSLAALDTVNRTLISWNPNPSTANSVTSIAIAQNRLFVGGSFQNISGQARTGIAIYNLPDLSLNSWNEGVWLSPSYRVEYEGTYCNISPNITPITSNRPGYVSALTSDGNNIYLSGGFNLVLGQERQSYAAIDAANLNLLSWAPQAVRYSEGTCSIFKAATSMSVADGKIYFNNGRVQFNGVSTTNSHVFDLTANRLLATMDDGLDVEGSVNTHILSPQFRFYGGDFKLVNGMNIGYNVGLKLRGGLETVNLEFRAHQILAYGKYIIAYDGYTRLRAYDTETKTTLPWNPSLSSGGTSYRILNLIIVGNELYASGQSQSYTGNTMGTFIKSYNLTTWTENNWNPTFALTGGSPLIKGLSANGQRLYAYGNFTSVNGSARFNVVAFDLSQANRPLLSLNVSLVGPNGSTPRVDGLLDDGEKIFLFGSFTTVNGQTRNSRAALNRTNFALTDWAQGKSAAYYSLLQYSFIYGKKILTPSSFGFDMIDRVTSDISGSHVSLFNTRNVRQFDEVNGSLIIYNYPATSDGIVSGKYINRGFFIIPAEDLAFIQ